MAFREGWVSYVQSKVLHTWCVRTWAMLKNFSIVPCFRSHLIVLCCIVFIIQISKLLYCSHFIREFLVLPCVQEINKMGKINAMFTWNCSPWKTLQSLFLRIQMWVQYCPLVFSFSFYSSYLDALRQPTSIKCMYTRTMHVMSTKTARCWKNGKPLHKISCLAQ